jgi:hypothetical protein
MTYTFKLSRRLAVSRDLVVVTILGLLTACSGDATAPEAGSPSGLSTPQSLQVIPHAVTIETGQRVRFRGQSRGSRGDLVRHPVAWGATGGSIEPDGTFSSSLTGTFKIIGRGRGWRSTDTSEVTVVSPATNLDRIEIKPRNVTLAAGASTTFKASGYRANGSKAPVGVIWSAEGGSVDAGGVYTADSVPGKFAVVAVQNSGSLSDTAWVTVTAPEKIDTVPPTPPTPVLTRIVLLPENVSLEVGAGRKFSAFGRNSAGDSVAVTVAFSATGGTVSSTGQFTAGQQTGNFRVIASAGGLADTAAVTVTSSTTSEPAPSAPGGTVGMGVPVGLWNLLATGASAGPYTMTIDPYTASTLLSRLADARSKGFHVFMNMTGGDHANYVTDGYFDLSKWKARMDAYNTREIRAAVAQAVADGTIVGNSVMDEPQSTLDGKSWGPAGYMTKAKVDQLCAYVKSIFPTLPTGVVHDHRVFEPEKNYAVCDFIVSQYRMSKGPVESFRDGGLAFARRSGIAISFSLNVLHGGPASTDCPKYGDDPSGTLCPMTPQQVRQFGLTLGTASCTLAMWRYQSAYYDDANIRAAVAAVGDSLARVPRTPCLRPASLALR